MSTFAGRYDKPLLKLVGNRLIPAKSATVEVFESDGVTQASLFTSRTKGTAADNPTAPDEVGNLEFFADPGTHVLSIIEDSSVVATNDVVVQPDPLEPVDTPTSSEIVGQFTGTPDGTQFLRDDGTLATPAGGGGVPIDATGLAAGDDIITGDNATIEESVDGTFRVVSTSATSTPLIVKGAASQSAPYIELRDSSGTVHGSLSKPGSGRLRLSGSTSASFPYIDLGPAEDARKTIVTCSSGGRTELHYHDNGVYVDIHGAGVDIVPKTGGVSITPASGQSLAFFGATGATGATQAANAGTASGTDATVINAIITALVNYGLMAA